MVVASQTQLRAQLAGVFEGFDGNGVGRVGDLIAADCPSKYLSSRLGDFTACSTTVDDITTGRPCDVFNTATIAAI